MAFFLFLKRATEAKTSEIECVTPPPACALLPTVPCLPPPFEMSNMRREETRKRKGKFDCLFEFPCFRKKDNEKGLSSTGAALRVPESAESDGSLVSGSSSAPLESSQPRPTAWEAQRSAQRLLIFVILLATGCAHANVSPVPACLPACRAFVRTS